MRLSADMQIVELDSFETAFPVPAGAEEAAKRRFMTLFAEGGEHARVGGTSYVCRAQSVFGEAFALKRLLPGAGLPEGVELSDEDTARITQGHAAAFYEEYRNQLLVSHLKGFPRLYGYGSAGGEPAILMEWVEGTSLREVARGYAGRGESVPARAVAQIGVAVLEVLESLGRLDAALVHRDISPANVLLRTEDASVEEQVEAGEFDVCLVDFGSAATAPQEGDPSFTAAARVWRNGTPEYAPPEMLTRDVPHVDELRKSQVIDVFALCSVLYELYAGRTPWGIGDEPGASAYRIKTERPPRPLQARGEGDGSLVEAIASGLAAEQERRPSVRELLARLRAWLGEDGAGVAASAADAAGRGRAGAADGLYTPDSTHLSVAGESEGGRRAGERVAPFEREQRLLTRRTLVVGGAALLAAAAIGGGVAAYVGGASRKPLGSYSISEERVASGLWQGEQLYPARDMDNNTWNLLAIDAKRYQGSQDLETKGRDPAGSWTGSSGCMRAMETR